MVLRSVLLFSRVTSKCCETHVAILQRPSVYYMFMLSTGLGMQLKIGSVLQLNSF